ncbi:hypothetical protein E4U42_003932 [Claviceps africana]|uniref:Uncharacterized protein n=1 Tax=Claviceps africana TaxID=83212 RepID=A0A8K0J629_9HYPO|nr:hypothetical protein E4U42_003932 [Claviceps africana]
MSSELEKLGFGGLLFYAANHWLEHFGSLSSSQLPEVKDIEHICHHGSRHFKNWKTVNKSLRDEYDPLIITSLYGSSAMLKRMLDTSDLANDAFRADSALAAAQACFLRPSQLKILLKNGRTGPQILKNPNFHALLSSQMRFWTGYLYDDIFDLIPGFGNVQDASFRYFAFSSAIQSRATNAIREFISEANCDYVDFSQEMHRGIMTDSSPRARFRVQSFISKLGGKNRRGPLKGNQKQKRKTRLLWTRRFRALRRTKRLQRCTCHVHRFPLKLKYNVLPLRLKTHTEKWLHAHKRRLRDHVFDTPNRDEVSGVTSATLHYSYIVKSDTLD